MRNRSLCTIILAITVVAAMLFYFRNPSPGPNALGEAGSPASTYSPTSSPETLPQVGGGSLRASVVPAQAHRANKTPQQFDPPFFDPAFSVGGLMRRVENGEIVAKRNLARLIFECANAERDLRNFDKMSPAEIAAAPQPIVTLWNNCRQIPPDYKESRSRLIREAAEAGDTIALTTLRFSPPEGRLTPEELDKWRSEVETLLGQNRSNPDVACALAQLYQDERFGRKDLKKALDFYRQILANFAPTTQCFRNATLMAARLKDVI